MLHHQQRKPKAYSPIAIAQREAKPARIDTRFGLCPRCRSWSGEFVREGRDAWLFCGIHEVKWFVTSTLLKGAGTRCDISGFDEVNPVYHPTLHMTKLSASHQTDYQR